MRGVSARGVRLCVGGPLRYRNLCWPNAVAEVVERLLSRHALFEGSYRKGEGFEHLKEMTCAVRN